MKYIFAATIKVYNLNGLVKVGDIDKHNVSTSECVSGLNLT